MQRTTEVCRVFLLLNRRGSGSKRSIWLSTRADFSCHDEVTLVSLVLVVYQIIQSYVRIMCVHIYFFSWFVELRLIVNSRYFFISSLYKLPRSIRSNHFATGSCKFIFFYSPFCFLFLFSLFIYFYLFFLEKTLDVYTRKESPHSPKNKIKVEE